ncbi:PLP-dependent aminotransferase family protein, partial [bacterium]
MKPLRYSWTMDSVAPSPLYLKVAAELKSLIDGGQLAPAQRVPSVRELMRQRGISLTTAVASLRNLEQRGLIEARPQSGYYVARREPRREEPRAPRLPRGARLVGLQAMVDRLAEASLDPQIAQLGQAIPDAGFFPQARLQRALAESLRRRPRLLGEYELRTAGLPALREEIVRHYARLGAALDAEEIVVTQGCTEAINLVLRSVLARGDTLAVESPTYYGVLRIIESLGVKVLEVPTRPRDGLDIDAFRSMLA